MNGDGLDALAEVACNISCPPCSCDDIVIMKNAGRVSAVGADIAEGYCYVGRWCAVVVAVAVPVPAGVLSSSQSIVTSAGQVITGLVTS